MNYCKVLVFFLFFFIAFYLQAQEAWTRITPTPQENTLNYITKIPGSERLIAVGEGSTVLISDNMGGSWKLILNPAGMNNDYQCKGVCFINESTGFIYGGKETILKTIDAGLTWELKYIGDTMYEWQSINDIAFVNELIGFAVGDEGQLFKTTDGGETWPIMPGTATFNLRRIEFANSTTGFITGENDTLLKTTDGGTSWSAIHYPAGLPELYITDLQFISDSIGFISGITADQTLLFKTTDMGVTWTQVYSSWNISYGGKFVFFDELSGFYALPTVVQYSTVIISTTDGGNTWNESWPDFLSWQDSYSLCAVDQNSVFSVGKNGAIRVSFDRGLNWESRNIKIFLGDKDTGYSLSKVSGGGIGALSLMKTTDGCSSWQLLMNDIIDLGALFFISEDTGFVVFHSWGLEVYRTLDGGTAWWSVNLTDFDFVPEAIKFSDYNNGYICGYGHLIRTFDAGNSWFEDDNGVIPWDLEFYDIEYPSADTVFVVGGSGNQTTMVKSTDGGYNFDVNTIGNYGPAKDIFFVNRQIVFLACYNTILKSTDGGDTWTATTLNNVNPIDFRSIYFPSTDTGYAVGDGPFENMVKTTDGGDTWNVIHSGISSGLSFVHFMNDNTGLVFGDDGVEANTTNGGIVGLPEPGSLVDEDYFKIYPNPGTQVVKLWMNQRIKTEGAEINIIDMKGQEMIRIQYEGLMPEMNIQIDHLKPGVYTIQLKNEKGIRESKKLIKL
jgi:photosystem II stability/assembly factor-like uncharacterized protein